MNNNLVNIKIHGVLGRKIGQKEWNLEVSSVSEALHAINTMSSSKLFYSMNELSRKGVKYIVKVNNEIQKIENKANPLILERGNLQSIDVAPVVEGAFLSTLSTVFGAGLMFFGDNALMRTLGATLMFAGISDALSKPPDLPEDRLITNPSSDPQALSQSYLFGGPVNVVNEGGPVPIGYGRLIVGSQVILTSYEVQQKLVSEAGRVI
jgi:predicted phage tail protein